MRGNTQWEETSEGEEDDAQAVLERARSKQLSVRQMLKMPRRTGATLDRVRGDLTPYKANPCIVKGAGISKRSAGVTSLLDVMTRGLQPIVAGRSALSSCSRRGLSQWPQKR